MFGVESESRFPIFPEDIASIEAQLDEELKETINQLHAFNIEKVPNPSYNNNVEARHAQYTSTEDIDMMYVTPDGVMLRPIHIAPGQYIIAAFTGTPQAPIYEGAVEFSFSESQDAVFYYPPEMGLPGQNELKEQDNDLLRSPYAYGHLISIGSITQIRPLQASYDPVAIGKSFVAALTNPLNRQEWGVVLPQSINPQPPQGEILAIVKPPLL